MQEMTSFPDPVQFTEPQRRTYQAHLERIKSPQMDYMALQSVPNEYRTRELFMEALRYDGTLLAYVPHKEDIDAEMAALAVTSNGFALQYLPQRLRTRDVCMAAAFAPARYSCAASVPKSVLNEALCAALVRQSSGALDVIPWEFKTEELFLAAVEVDGKALSRVPEEARSPRLCEAAVRQAPVALEHVPVQWRSETICRLAVQRDVEAVAFVPRAILRHCVMLAIALESEGQGHHESSASSAAPEPERARERDR